MFIFIEKRVGGEDSGNLWFVLAHEKSGLRTSIVFLFIFDYLFFSG